MTSRSPGSHAWHVSATVAMVSVPVVGLWMEICLLQIGLLFGLAGLFIRWTERATLASPFWMLLPHEPGESARVSILMRRWKRIKFLSEDECGM